MEQQRSGDGAILWIAATPIGNLGDCSERLLALLQRVPIIAAEDTRVSRRLLPQRADEPRWFSLNEHNEQRQVPLLIAALQSGQDVALLSDAGTPLISDPGFRLVDAAHRAGIRVSPLPGPSAAVAALSVAGLPSDRFWFEGFLPARSAARIARLRQLQSLPATLIFYVPARDLPAVLADALQVFDPTHPAALARELSKLHETVMRLPLAELLSFCQDDPQQSKGEAVLLLGGGERQGRTIDADSLAAELAIELPPSRAARVLARVSGLNRQQAWAMIERCRASLTDEN